jgi:adenylate cyclase
MTQLSIFLLGSFRVALDGEPVTGFVSDKARALLAFLAVEAERAHRREALAGLLWPNYPERSARASLRNALANVRQVIGDREADPPFLCIAGQTIQFNPEGDAQVDVSAFTESLEPVGASSLSHPGTIHELEAAVALYQGEFLEGFSLPDSPAFEEWALLKREQLQRRALAALGRLADHYERRGDYERALQFAWRRVEADPYRGVAQRGLMRLLALSGQREAALAQYETFRRLLAEEMGIAPAGETTRLCERIQAGELAPPAPVPRAEVRVQRPAFLEEAAEREDAERPVFVARERELARLDGFLETALQGEGRVVFITGGPGRGKTVLMNEFARRAMETHPDLLVASGHCNAHTGIGDPYLPFREILSLLTGGVDPLWAAGAITRDHARRLWHILPMAVDALVEVGPDLVNTFIPGPALVRRARAYAAGETRDQVTWFTRLKELVDRKAAVPHDPSTQQSALFEQYARVMAALARERPLLLTVDDLQWVDGGSSGLLFHLSRGLAGVRVLIVGAYRPEEVAAGRPSSNPGERERHPLEPLVNEFQRTFGDIAIDLARAEDRRFVEEYLASEPHRLSAGFRETLYRQTRGHPLFTIELLRGLQERRDLVQDPEGRWVEGPALDWETLPARVEAVIAERIGRLAEPLQDALRVASVEGEVFTAEVVARVQVADEREVVARLSGELDRRHRLVRAQGIQRMDGQRLSHYRFRHILFQRYLYNNLDEVERAHLHEAVGNTLEALYKDQIEEMAAIAGQLAWHFQAAGIAEKAIHYLRQAGEKAVQLSAYQEGVAHLTRGLALLLALPDSDDAERRLERAQQELALQLALGIAWRSIEGYGPEAEAAYTRARELCQQTENTSQLCQVLGKLSILHFVRAEHQKAREFAEEALSLAQQAEDPLHIALGHWYLGSVLLCLGEYTAARTHFEPMISFYEPQQHHRSLVFLRGSDAGTIALAYDACCLWCLGYPERALKQSQEALALTRELGHPFSLVEVLYFAGCLLNETRRDGQALKDDAEELISLSNELAPGWSAEGISLRGEALVMLGQVREGMAQLREGLAAYRSFRGLRHLPGRLCFLAEAQAQSGHPEEGLATLAEALALVEETGERHWEAELYRLRAELLLMQGDDTEAEASLHKAIEVARRQNAKSWELRATVSLCRLWQEQGRTDKARQMLAEIYNWFTEGFDTTDLIEAKRLLEELSS